MSGKFLDIKKVSFLKADFVISSRDSVGVKMESPEKTNSIIARIIISSILLRNLIKEHLLP